MAKEGVSGRNLHSIQLDIFDGCDEDYKPTADELLELWEDSCVEYAINKKAQPTHTDLMKLWDEACSEFKIRTVMATADRKDGFNAGTANQETTADELKAAFNQAFEELNGKDFETVHADNVAQTKDSTPLPGSMEDKKGPIKMRDIFANLLKR
jgi:preprotein translocase subunit SecA